MPKTGANRRSDASPSRPDEAAVTIGGLARAAEVGVDGPASVILSPTQSFAN